MEGYQHGSGRGTERGKVQRISSINGRWKIDRGRVRIVEAKELISMTHGHVLWGGGCGREGMGRMEWSEWGEMGQL